MAQINQGGIQFNQVKTVGISLDQWPFRLSGQIGPDEDGGIVNAIDIDWNGAEVEENVVINTTGELLSWIQGKSSFDASILNEYSTKSYVNQRIEALIGEAPETLDTLKEIADALNDNATMEQVSQAISTKANSDDVYTKDEVDLLINQALEENNVQLRAENDILLERIKALEKSFSELVPEEPQDESYNVIIPTSNEPLTAEEIAASINPNAEKPELVQSLNMTQLENPTDTYLVYPLSWEIIENDQIISPIIKDWNGFEIGFNVNEETPTVTVNDIEYRVSDIKLGKGKYTIEFK